jgi:hypothetical protein
MVGNPEVGQKKQVSRNLAGFVPAMLGPGYSSREERAPENREMKAQPTILLIIKDRLSEPTMCMKTKLLTG